MLNFCFAALLELADKEAKVLIDERMKFFAAALSLSYDKNKFTKKDFIEIIYQYSVDW